MEIRGWICVPLVVEAYGGWGITAKETFSRIVRRLERVDPILWMIVQLLIRERGSARVWRCRLASDRRGGMDATLLKIK